MTKELRDRERIWKKGEKKGEGMRDRKEGERDKRTNKHDIPTGISPLSISTAETK